LHHDPGAKSDRVRGDLRLVDVRELGEPLRELPQTRLHQLLPFKRGLVLRILPQIAHLHGATDLAREGDIELEAELLRFVREFLLERLDHATALEVWLGEKARRPTDEAGRRNCALLLYI
jgi:hypothetical protein